VADEPFESDVIAGKVYDGRLVRRLLRSTAPHRRLIFLAFLFLAVSTGVDLTLPYLTKIGIDRYLARLYNVYEAPPETCERLLAADPARGDLLEAATGLILLRKGSQEELARASRAIIEREGRLSTETYYVFPAASRVEGAGRILGRYWIVPEADLRKVPPVEILKVRGADLVGIYHLAWITAALILVGLGAGYGHMLTLQIAGQRSMYDLRMSLFRHLQRLARVLRSKSGRKTRHAGDERHRSIERVLHRGPSDAGQDALCLSERWPSCCGWISAWR
jgi:ATP-binding cassette subfamily B protein